MCKYTRGQKGFTILELLVVIVIIGILAAIALPKYAGVRKDATLVVSKSNLKSLQTAMERYNLDEGQYPTNFSALVSDNYVKSNNCYVPNQEQCYEYGFNDNDFLIVDTVNNIYATSDGVKEDFGTYQGGLVPTAQTL